MISTIVRIRLDASIDEDRVRNIAASSRSRFDQLEGLRLKAYTFDRERNEILNVYLWHSEAAARKLFTSEALSRIAQLYGGEASVDFLEVAELVDNG